MKISPKEFPNRSEFPVNHISDLGLVDEDRSEFLYPNFELVFELFKGVVVFELVILFELFEGVVIFELIFEPFKGMVGFELFFVFEHFKGVVIFELVFLDL